MDLCTKCGICQSHCPVVAATPNFPGPKYAGPQAARFRIIDEVLDHSTDLCTACGVCSSVCPNDVAITDIIVTARAQSVGQGEGVSLRQRLLNRPDLLGRIGSIAPTLANLMLRNSVLRVVAEKVLGLDRRSPLPHFHGNAFRRWFARRSQPDGPPVHYFTGCAVDNYDPETGKAVVRLLNALGFSVKISEPGCCSLPMLSTGEWKQADERAKRLTQKLARDLPQNAVLVSSSTSCSLTLKSKYKTYLGLESPESEHVSSAVNDICHFVRDQRLDEIARIAKPTSFRVLYHPPCQLRGHGIGTPALELLRQVPGLEIVLSKASCCGIGGTYGYDKNKFEVSQTVGLTLKEQSQEIKPDFIVCDSETCRWHIEEMTGVKTLHPISFLVDHVIHCA
ncbi:MULTISPECIES: anaerobic glycerol-3-phosphate dehydrogenase subunit C [unclassified Mesorhizobium]|uniref:anaerobic glycerol-3-phosphate dehydrogenase subunit C n=1 Tax=unclassified Mesorhizobium TaxID=325217 RepID=UPI001FE0CEE1|nr:MULTISPECIES: anaerobic glycerol-3-phosphate dehydrogenase subunit C [unclassified Mesorhizobium]